MYAVRALATISSVIVCALLLSACATDGPPDPGTQKWYDARIAEIEAAKAAGELTTEQYLALKGQADATRAARLNAMRYNDYYYPSGGLFIGGHVDHHNGNHGSGPSHGPRGRLCRVRLRRVHLRGVRDNSADNRPYKSAQAAVALTILDENSTV